MSKNTKSKIASSIVEYMVVVLFIFSIIFVFQAYLVRGFSGRWKSVGDTFGSGRQYDPKRVSRGGTLECFYHRPSGLWIATRCYEDCLRGLMGDPCGPPICSAGLGFGSACKEGCCRNRCDENDPQYTHCGADEDFSF